MKKSMGSSKANQAFMTKLVHKIYENFVSDIYGDIIIEMSIQGGVIQNIKLKKFNKEDVIKLKE